jgi:hypothetical protein
MNDFQFIAWSLIRRSRAPKTALNRELMQVTRQAYLKRGDSLSE